MKQTRKALICLSLLLTAALFGCAEEKTSEASRQTNPQAQTSARNAEAPVTSSTAELQPGMVIAEGSWGEDITWTLDDNGLLTVSGHGEMLHCNGVNWHDYKIRAFRVRVLEGVTRIAELPSEFVESVTIPGSASVTVQALNRFRDSSKLTDIQVSPENPKYSSLNGVLYNKAQTELLCYPGGKTDTSFAIPEGVTSIGKGAFNLCPSLTSVTLPNGVTRIGDYAFWNSKSLTSVTIPDSVTDIDNSAFHNCVSLTDVTIPNSVTRIGDYAFCSCKSLTSVTIPNSVTRIGDAAFRDCKSFTSVTIPNSVTRIGDYAFDNCVSLTDVTIPNSATRIGDRAFNACPSLTSVTIPESVTSIGDKAFWGCDSLVIYGSAGSYAEKYAKENNIPFEAQ